MTKSELLVEIDSAISGILSSGQAYSVLGRTFTKANLADLWAMRKETEAAILDETRGGGRVFVVVPS